MPILRDIFVTFGLTIAVLLICHRLKIPTLVGIIFTGMLCGPDSLRLIYHIDKVEMLAEIGVIILLFTIGMEISLKRLLSMKRLFFIGGITQVSITALGAFGVAQILVRPLGESFFLGCLLALSSTAIVLKLLIDRLEEHSPHGRLILAILIFQDIIAIPMMLMIPVFAGKEAFSFYPFFYYFALGLLAVAFLFFISQKILPILFYYVAKTESRELFLLTVLFICTSVTWGASQAGLSLSLGAFLAGLVLSDTEYRHQAIGDILPFQDVFTSFFFISIGMLVDIDFLFAEPLLILSVASAVIGLKMLSAGLAAFLIGVPLRTVVLVAFSIFQIGEFSFVLTKEGIVHGIGTPFLHQLFLSVSLISMMLTPVLIKIGPKISDWLASLTLPPRLIHGTGNQSDEESHERKDHVIIAGFGMNGRHLAYTCKKLKIDYLILDMSPELISAERARGEPIYFGDATHQQVLHFAGIEKARVLVVAINDMIAARQIIVRGRKLNKDVMIIARTRHLAELKHLYDLGADYVISNEFEASVSIFSHVLRQYLIPEEEIEMITQKLRRHGFRSLA